MQDNTKKVIGRVEPIDISTIHVDGIHARIDTGAKTSSIWASGVELEDGRLQVVFFGEASEHYDGAKHEFETFERRMVASSNGHVQERYAVQLSIRIGERRVRALFTLADRSTQVYPVLIGRNVLHGKFVVDVDLGSPLKEKEQARESDLRSRGKS